MTDRPAQFFTDPGLSDVPGISHGFFTKNGGVSSGLYASLNIGFGSGDDRAAVTENRARAMAALDLPAAALTTVYQVHGTTVARVQDPWRHDAAPKADALVTNRPGVALGIATADCAPVLFADLEAQVVGACHAGWKGALGGVTEATIAAMEELGARRNTIRAVVGPCIAQVSYEVGAEFRAAFLERDQDFDRFFAAGAKPEKYQFDLPGFVLHMLGRSGLADACWTGHDTRAEEDLFFSYRRSTLSQEGDYGRLLSSIAIPKQDKG